jgi:adenylate kinase
MLNIILIGPQGCGKGTQAEMIVREFGLAHIETGSMIRKRAQLHDHKAVIINHLANQKGILLPDGIVLDMIYDELSENISNKGYLFDGFPRTVKQYQALKGILIDKGLSLNIAIYLNITNEESLRRLESRRICKLCKKGYSLLIYPNIRICTCGGELIKRVDDEAEAIKRRLMAFYANTKPILELMQKDDILFEVNGDQTIDKISSEIRTRLNSI